MAEEHSLRELLTTARRRVGWTQEEVADKLGVSRVAVNRWENGEQRPSTYSLKKIVGVFGFAGQDKDALFRAAAQAPVEVDKLASAQVPLTAEPVIDNLPFIQNPFFTGREAELEQLRILLQEHHSVALIGLGGVGKTQIALEYAYRPHTDAYLTVLWVNAADPATLQADCASLAETLKLPKREEENQEWRIKTVTNWLKKHTNWLLIMDNADDLLIVQPFLLARPCGHIILTTRWQFPDKFARPLAVEVMGQEDGQLFLSRRTNRLPQEAELNAANRLVELLEGHALALEQAGAYIQETGVSFTSYLNLYQENRKYLLDQYGTLGDEHSEHPLTVTATFKMSLAKATELSPIAEDILHFCSFLQPDIIPEEFFRYDENFKTDIMAFNKGIAALQRYSLIRRNTQKRTSSIHRLVQAVLIDDMASDLQKQWQERVVSALNAAFPELEYRESVQLDQLERLVPYVLDCATWTDNALSPAAEVAVELFHKASTFLNAAWRYSEVEILLARVVSIYKRRFGVEHPNTASALNDLAFFYFDQGKDGQAESLCQQCLTIRVTLLGNEHPETAMSLYLLAQLYHVHGEYGHAESLYQRTIMIWEKHLGPKHPNIAHPLYGLASLKKHQGEHEQAKALYHRVISILEQQFGTTHPNTQVSKRAYTELPYSIGRDAKATALKAEDEPTH